MGRRFLLVGLFIIFPFAQGTMMQVAAANIMCLIYLFLQLQAMPFRDIFENYLAVTCSLSLSTVMLCTIFYKYLGLTELSEINARMSLYLHRFQ